MKFKSARMRGFKRFTDLTVQGVPDTAQLIVLAGPNGSGKSSFFDALRTWHGWTSRKARLWDPDYHGKAGTPTRNQMTDDVQVEFHDTIPEQREQRKKIIYARSAYRNESEFRVDSLVRQGDPLDHVSSQRMIDEDRTVSRNYQRLASEAISDLFDGGQTTFDEYLEETIGGLRKPLSRLFPGLSLDSLGKPLENGTFSFTKGASSGFVFKNLSGGEKAAFDLILDIVMAVDDYDDTIYCIDEPESHLHASLQAELLSVLDTLIPKNCQLMVATHSIGMMRQARDIEAANPGSVVFLDFGGREFDGVEVIEPAKINRMFWKQAYNIALGDLAELVAPNQVVICEGEPLTSPPVKNHSLDARCYERIFEDEFPETEFISMGSDQQIVGDKRGLAEALRKLIGAISVVRLIDLDDHSHGGVEDLARQGVRVLSRRNLESYLFDDEVLRTLADSTENEDHIEELLTEKQRILAKTADRPVDDLKPARGRIYLACKKIFNLKQPGNDTEEFMRDTLAPLISPGMVVYGELKRDIFGED